MRQIDAARKTLLKALGRRQGSFFYHTPHAYLKLPTIKAFTSPRFLSDPNGVSGKYGIAQSAPRIDVHILEFPENPGTGECWSCWGQGILTADGRLYFAAGNHLESGGAGNSHLYCYD